MYNFIWRIHMVRAIPKETFSMVMEVGEDVKFIQGKEYKYKKFADGFIVKGENGTVKISVEEAERLFSRKIKV